MDGLHCPPARAHVPAVAWRCPACNTTDCRVMGRSQSARRGCLYVRSHGMLCCARLPADPARCHAAHCKNGGVTYLRRPAPCTVLAQPGETLRSPVLLEPHHWHVQAPQLVPIVARSHSCMIARSLAARPVL